MSVRRVSILLGLLLIAGTALATSKPAKGPAARKMPPNPPLCLYTMEDPPPPCTGVPPGPEMYNRPKVRVCNACLKDGDCREKPRGRCVRTHKGPCAGDGSRACAYPGDGCYSDGPHGGDCAICLNIQGRATCSPLPQMPPSMPPPRTMPGPGPGQ